MLKLLEGRINVMIEKVRELVLKILELVNADEETVAKVNAIFDAIADFLAPSAE